MNRHAFDSDILQMEKLLGTHGIADPLPSTTIAHRAKRKKALYFTILRALGIYSAAAAVSVTLFFAGKKIIAALSVKSATALLGASVLTAGSAYVIYSHAAKNEPVAKPEVQPAVTAEEEPAAPKVAEVIHYRIGIRPIESESVDADERAIMGNTFIRAFTEAKGAKYAALSRNVADNQIDYALRTTVEKLGDTYVISAKIVDLKSLAVVFMAKETIPSGGNPEEKIAGIARKIAESVQ